MSLVAYTRNFSVPKIFGCRGGGGGGYGMRRLVIVTVQICSVRQ